MTGDPAAIVRLDGRGQPPTELIGAKAASLDTMCRLDLPVPPAFCVPAPLCTARGPLDETVAILRTIESNRFVTGVTWLGNELWHATWEGDESELRRVNPKSGEVLESIELPAGVNVSGLESNGKDTFYCGSGGAGKVRAVTRSRS